MLMTALKIRPRQILVVDDDSSVRQTIAMLLRLDGHVVVVAASGEEALELFRPGKFDLVFTDYAMPRMTGAALAAAIKRQDPAQPVVMLSAYPEQVASSGVLQTEIDLFIQKPFEPDTLRAAITKFAPAPA
ncbi:MAG: two-component system, cell cycle sensor histidine kinase and response regulator CckA [Verrucomicrobiota bacterium]